MRLHTCPSCASRAFFDNLVCSCGEALIYDAGLDAFVTGASPCANREAIGCNWRAAREGGFCVSCAMTRTHPDLAVPDNAALWSRAEAAKRWVLANLARFGWFTADDPGPRPVFDLLAERTSAGPSPMVMGHADGVITIAVAEADRVELVTRREEMGEPYRTMIGHFRHEIAHFLHQRLGEERDDFLDGFRALFGDERADYGEALKRHYASPDDRSWQASYISHYASAHPHEDWAETAAHALHLTDLLDSARAVGFAGPGGDTIAQAIDLGIALNHVNRSMGMDDLYPFVVSPRAREKLDWALGALRR